MIDPINYAILAICFSTVVIVLIICLFKLMYERNNNYWKNKSEEIEFKLNELQRERSVSFQILEAIKTLNYNLTNKQKGK